MATYGIHKRVFEKVLEEFMKIHEEIKKASAILKLSAKEKRKYLRKIDCSNNIHEYEDVCQELASMLIEYSNVNGLDNDKSLWQLIDEFYTARAFYCVINYNPKTRGDKMEAFYSLSKAAGACERLSVDYPENQSLIYTGVATPKELEKLYFEKFGENIEFDPEDRVDEDTLSELVNSDLLCKYIFFMGNPF